MGLTVYCPHSRWWTLIVCDKYVSHVNLFYRCQHPRRQWKGEIEWSHNISLQAEGFPSHSLGGCMCMAECLPFSVFVTFSLHCSVTFCVHFSMHCHSWFRYTKTKCIKKLENEGENESVCLKNVCVKGTNAPSSLWSPPCLPHHVMSLTHSPGSYKCVCLRERVRKCVCVSMGVFVCLCRVGE